MSSTQPAAPQAWEPVTPRGVAAFALARPLRLFIAQSVIAVFAAVVVVWFLSQAWFPVVREAIRQLPAQGEIRGQQLDWRGDSPMRLAGNHCLAIAVDLTHSGRLGREAQLQIELGRSNLRVFSTVDYAVIDYPAGWRIAFNRPELEPRWGAWEPALLAGAASVTVLCLVAAWLVLATLYWLPVRIITLYENRDLNWRQSWRLAGAALVPGELFLLAAIVAHGLGWMDLIQLGGAAALSVFIGWIFLFVSPLFLPRHPSVAKVKGNPFASAAGPEKSPPN